MTLETESDQAVHVLVVEDDIHIGRLIGLTMPALGMPYRFTNVMSAIEALELWKKETFDLLLTDYNLPGMNGLQLIDSLKKQGITSPMILFTAYDTPELERKARNAGVAAYLSKPFAIDELIETIRMLLPERTPVADRE
ncbi:MAG: response regulator [Chloroflexaceae bacterium]|nr:response regulator [Chloroflexaceae bacterium]